MSENSKQDANPEKASQRRSAARVERRGSDCG